MATAIELGAVIDGKYRVVRRIGEGGMGTVYEGENIRIERRVAIKVLHEHVASTPEFAQRFEREARASARIGSPHVCDVLDLGDLPNGERFIVMEFLDGESLEDRLLKGRLTAAQLAPIAFEILEGLGTMHQAGVVHRDLKPANVFLARGHKKAEIVKILDFGVAKILPRADEPSEMTSTGMMMGTPLYMSPEQARGARDVDGRTDIYAASVIFYRALTGELPHSGDNLHELLFKIVLDEPPPIRDLAPDVDEAFAEIVMKGLARDADARYPSARAYQEEIARWGAAQGRASLQFAVTLPSEPPPLRAVTGGFPAARVRAPITGPQVPPEKVGPPTPAIAKTQTETPVSKQSGGTPIVWSEDAPEIAKRALAELEAKRQSEKERGSNAGKTQVLGPTSTTAPSESAAIDAPAPAVKARSQGKSRVAMAAGAAAVLAIAAIGLRFGAPDSAASASPSPSSPETSAPVVASDPPAADPPPVQGIESAPSATAAASAEPAPEASATPVATATATTKAPPPTTARVAPPTPKVATTGVSSSTAKPASSAAQAATATATATAAPTATATTKTRKFRTNLD